MVASHGDTCNCFVGVNQRADNKIIGECKSTVNAAFRRGIRACNPFLSTCPRFRDPAYCHPLHVLRATSRFIGTSQSILAWVMVASNEPLGRYEQANGLKPVRPVDELPAPIAASAPMCSMRHWMEYHRCFRMPSRFDSSRLAAAMKSHT